MNERNIKAQIAFGFGLCMVSMAISLATPIGPHNFWIFNAGVLQGVGITLAVVSSRMHSVKLP